jgi:nucleoside phosphorylase
MFDENYETPLIDQTFDKNTYTCGCINGHNVVVASKGLGETGVVNASVVMGSLLHNFRALKATLVVGTAGGFPFNPPKPDPMEDIHLGDVAVGWAGPSEPSLSQWDSGIYEPDGFQVISIFNPPGLRFRTALGRLNHERNLSKGFDRFKQNLDRCISNHPDLFRRPDPESDILFNSAYPHPQGNRNCKECVASEKVDRPVRTAADVKVHYGPIASGSGVMKSGKKRDNIRDTTRAICVEMSAAGVQAWTNALVIKGISDYADSHKTNDMEAWRSYAAATAAAFTRELLYAMDPGILKDLGSWNPPATDKEFACLRSLAYPEMNYRRQDTKRIYSNIYN